MGRLLADSRQAKKYSPKRKPMLKNENGKVGWILLWAIGVPVPVLMLLFLVRGCT
jgi:hypothetical protein